MSPNKELTKFSRSLLLTIGTFVAFVIAFAIYVRAEKQIDRAYESRYQSYVLADVLRQSSDDLTRMVRSYVATGDIIYKKRYQEILDIRDGKKPRPVKYEDIYWDLVLADDRRPRPDGQAFALLELMRQAGFSAAEFAKLAQAKANSDTLTKPEFAAMALIESTVPPTESNRLKATRMLNDAAYHQAKADIMRPISEFYRMVDQRTLEAVLNAENAATLVRVMLVALGILLAFALWTAYRALHATLGCSVDELQGHIVRLGSGDLSTPTPVPQNIKNSVLAWLLETQANLVRIDVERKHAEAAVRQLNAELEQRVVQRTLQLEAANKELEEFSYSMSHDMRTPLRALDGFSKILLEEHGSNLDDEGKRLLKVLRDNAQRMGRLVDDILRYLSMGRRKIEFSTIDVAKLALEVGNELQATMPARRLRLEIAAIPPVWGDRAMIREVLQNLLSNAVKFAQTEGEVLIELGGMAEEEENVYSVKDYGVGFDMRFSDKLFRVFERVHPTGQYNGSGVGLAIVKRIITRHKGRVWAEGKLNEGATIYFALPSKGKNHGQ
jgi:signal transduction histidine kinase